MKKKKTKKNNDIFNVDLDQEEQEISDAVDLAIAKGKLKSVDNLKEELSFAKEAAAKGLKLNGTKLSSITQLCHSRAGGNPFLTRHKCLF